MRTLVILICFLVLSGCDQQSQHQQRREATAHKADQDQAMAKRAAEHEAEREKERQLMVTPLAIPELERRLGEWLEPRSGLLFVKDQIRATSPEFRDVNAISLQTPWVVTCNRRGLEVVLGSWVEVDCSSDVTGGSSNLFFRRLTKIKLSESECAPLLMAVGQKMSQIMKGTP